MKKFMIIAGLAGCLAGTVIAEGSSEYEAMNMWLFESMLDGVTPESDKYGYGEIKAEWSQFGDNIFNNVKASLPPVDPSITAAMTKISADHSAEMEGRVKALGYASYDEFYMTTAKGNQFPDEASEELWQWYLASSHEVSEQRTALMADYTTELRRRYEAAFVDAVKKLQQNSSTMQ